MIEIKERDWYNQYGEFELIIKVKDATTREVMKLQGIANRTGKEIRKVLEANPLIVANSDSNSSGYTLPQATEVRNDTE